MKEYPTSKEPDAKKKVNKRLVIRALTDPEFREMLAADPRKVLGLPRFSTINEQEIKFVLAAVQAIEYQIAGLADELLCANGDPCAIG
jgi:hypothetical protein